MSEEWIKQLTQIPILKARQAQSLKNYPSTYFRFVKPIECFEMNMKLVCFVHFKSIKKFCK